MLWQLISIKERPFQWMEGKLDIMSIFALMWALATFTHQFTFNTWMWMGENYILGWLLMILAILVIFYLRNTALFLLMVATSVVYIYLKLPKTPNHIFFEWWINFPFLVCASLAYYQLKKAKEDQAKLRDTIMSYFIPLARTSLLVLYFWVVIHKLNWDYFHLDNSCAVYLLTGFVWEFNKMTVFWGLEQFGVDYIYSTFTKIFVIFSSLFFEAVIPLLLLFKRTRLLGIGVGILFHTLLAFHPHDGIYSFSALLLAIYVLFEPNKIRDHFNNLLSYYREKRMGKILKSTSPFLLILLFALILILEYRYPEQRPAFRSGFITFLLISATSFLFWLQLFRKTAFEEDSQRFMLHPMLWFAPFFIFLNGLTPYLGLKTESTFSMFSNLKTETDTPNHIFIPKSIRIFDYQDDIIKVTSSNTKIFNNDNYHEAEERYYTVFEFKKKMRKFMMAKKDFIAEVEYEGESFTFRIKNGTASHPEWVKKHPYWKLKTLCFRPIYYGPSLCQH